MKITPIRRGVMNQPSTLRHSPLWTWRAARLTLALLTAGLLASSAWAQTVVIRPITLNYWAGINTGNALGTGTNVASLTGANGIATVALSVLGQPAGLTYNLTTNSITNSIFFGVNLFATNVAAGAYPLTLNASGAASYATNVNLFVVPQWAFTNGTANWSDASSWSGGSVPSDSDSVYFENQFPGTGTVGYTNIVNVSKTIQDLIILGDHDANLTLGSAWGMQIPSGVTLSVLGTNGFVINSKASGSNMRPWYDFSGSGTLLVSNPAANFIVNNNNSGGTTRASSIFMTNLDNLAVTVNRFGVADINLSMQGLRGVSTVSLSLARTNFIKALWSDDYNAVNFNCGLQFKNMDDLTADGTQPAALNLGRSNVFFADSISVGKGRSGGVGSAFGITSPIMKFPPIVSNSVAPTAVAYLRGTNGGPISLLAIGYDTGTNNAAGNNTGAVDFRGGKIDVLVDKIWLGGNRTNNSSGTAKALGGLYFDWGNISANTVVAGYSKYTNGCNAQGFLSVGTNGTLSVANYIELGHTPDNVAGFESVQAQTTGQLRIDNGGTILANQINVGKFGTNNIITVNPGGLLVVSNTIGSSTGSLTTLSLNGAQLTFSVIPGVTNAYVTNLNTTTTASKINIASAPAGESTNVLMVYQVANQVPNIGIGTLPAGFNNMQILVDPTAMTVSLIVSTNQPKNLAWRGSQNSQWDHTSQNWIDLSLGTPTKFTDGDSVTFDDTAAVPTSITIADTVNPGQSGVGVTVSNNVNNFVFNSTGTGTIGSGTLVKLGSRSLQIDAATSLGAQVNGGTVTVGSSGSIANATTAADTTLNVSGTVSGGVTCAGNLSNSGTIVGSLSLLTSASAANSGTVSGVLSMQTGTSLNNSGSLNNIGSPTVATNSTLINSGIIYGSTLTVAAGGTLTDTVLGSAGNSAGSLNVGTLLINGTFNPGGNALTSTKVTDFNLAGDIVGSPNGRIQLNGGSVTTFKIDLANAQVNTKLLSKSQIFGPSAASKAINGGTLVLTNIGATPFAAGQTFKLFGSYFNDGPIIDAGLNSTNSYPIIKPATPGSGLAWDLSHLYPGGTVGVISASSVQISLATTTTFVGGTNIITELSWPADYIGSGWLQQQITALTNGLGTNWNNVGASDYVNDILLTNTITADQAVFFRFVRP